MTTLTNDQRAIIRRAMLTAGVSTSNLTDEQMAEWYASHDLTAAEPKGASAAAMPAVAAPVEPQPAPVPQGVDAALDAIRAALAAPKAAPFDEARVVELIREHSAAPRPIDVTVHTATRTKKVGGQHKAFPEVLAWIGAGVNIVAVGPAGSGKSTLFENVAATLELDYYFQGAVQQEHKILGYQDANGQYQRTQFRDAYEHGGLFVFEEFDGSSARALLAINNAVAGDWCDFPDGKVAKHENFVCVMAGNTFGTGATRQYVGRQQLDAATLDRFAFVEIGYDEALERAMCAGLYEHSDEWVSEVQAVRKAVEQAGIKHVVSPRASVAGCKALAAGLNIKAVRAAVLYKGLDRDTIRQIQVEG